jgi:acetyltransferase-like isoleucine patch superfamily enzyme
MGSSVVPVPQTEIPSSVNLRNVLDVSRNCAHPRVWLANGLGSLLPTFASGFIRSRIFRALGFDVHPGAFIMSRVIVISGMPGVHERLHIADGARIAPGVVVNLDDHVHIGEKVTIGPFSKIYTTTHELGTGSQRCDPAVVNQPVTIERGAWVAMGVTILPGVTVGQGAVVAAGSVVTKDVPPNVFVQGCPAEVVNKLPFGNR